METWGTKKLNRPKSNTCKKAAVPIALHFKAKAMQPHPGIALRKNEVYCAAVLIAIGIDAYCVTSFIIHLASAFAIAARI